MSYLYMNLKLMKLLAEAIALPFLEGCTSFIITRKLRRICVSLNLRYERRCDLQRSRASIGWHALDGVSIVSNAATREICVTRVSDALVEIMRVNI